MNLSGSGAGGGVILCGLLCITVITGMVDYLQEPTPPKPDPADQHHPFCAYNFSLPDGRNETLECGGSCQRECGVCDPRCVHIYLNFLTFFFSFFFFFFFYNDFLNSPPLLHIECPLPPRLDHLYKGLIGAEVSNTAR